MVHDVRKLMWIFHSEITMDPTESECVYLARVGIVATSHPPVGWLVNYSYYYYNDDDNNEHFFASCTMAVTASWYDGD